MRVRTRTIHAALILALGANAAAASAQSRASGSVILGSSLTTRDTSLLTVPGASVTIVELARQVTSDEVGSFSFTGVPRGHYTIDVRRLGFREFRDTVTTNGTDTVAVTALLTSVVRVLDAVKIERPSLDWWRDDFERRERMGGGVFLTRAQLEKYKSLRLTDVMRSSSVSVERRTDYQRGPRAIPVSRRGPLAARGLTGPTSACQMTLWLDGIRQADELADLEQLNTDDIEAIEIYRGLSEVPIQYAGRAPGSNPSCGVILVWMRYR